MKKNVCTSIRNPSCVILELKNFQEPFYDNYAHFEKHYSTLLVKIVNFH